MTTDFTFDGNISSPEDFEAALDRLVLAAQQNDVDLRGTWDFRTDGAAPDMEVMIVELTE